MNTINQNQRPIIKCGIIKCLSILSITSMLGACSSIPSLSALTPWGKIQQASSKQQSLSEPLETISINQPAGLLADQASGEEVPTEPSLPQQTPTNQSNTQLDNVLLPTYQTQYTYAQVDAYVNRLFMALQHNAPKHLARQSIAVVNFVKFDQALTNVTLLGQHITEHLMQEGQRVGYRIIEHKVSNRIQQSSKGDTVFDYYLSHQAHEFDAVLTGTIIASPTGLNVHARIVDVNNQAILTSASVLIPRFIVDQLPQQLLSRKAS